MPKPKNNLYDRLRYSFDEDDMFYHFSSEKEEKELADKNFPWWKPSWENGRWVFRRHDGKALDMALVDDFPYPDLFPEYRNLLEKAFTYEGTPAFVITWMKSVVYNRSVVLWNEMEKKFKAEFPDKKSQQIDKLCDAEVQKFFDRLKG